MSYISMHTVRRDDSTQSQTFAECFESQSANDNVGEAKMEAYC